MASIALCPRCTSHLALPPGVDAAAQVQCPICEVEFSLATVTPRDLPQARLVEPLADFGDVEAATRDDAPAIPSPQERLSRLLRTSPNWGAPAPSIERDVPAPSEALAAEDVYEDAYEDADPELAPPEPAQDEAILQSRRRDDLLTEFRGETDDLAQLTATSSELRELDAEAEFADEELVADPLDGAPPDEELPLDLRTAPRRKRRPAGVRTLVGAVGGGALGLLLGAYGLLWLKGPAGDFAGLSQWLPPAMLPASMQSMADADADDAAASEERGNFDEASPEIATAEQPPRRDAAVTPAAAVEPVLADSPSLGEPTPPAGWSTSPVVGDLRDVKFYSAADLDELLDAADAAHRQFLAGDLARQESWSTMGPAYMTLAALAERFTLTDPADFGNELVTTQVAAKNIFRGAVGNPARRTDLGTIAARWLQHERRQNNGVLLIGRVRDLRPSGKWTEYVVDVPLGENTVAANVLMDSVEFSIGDEVAVAGAIVPRPQEQLAEYTGEASQVVVAGYAFVPETFVAPKPTADSGLSPFEAGSANE